jgi:8-oxo-dGTP pyrophosphatase MutT (NUDIX family)
VLLQQRAPWTHLGGTWALPGGARHEGESALDAAFREAAEEAAVPTWRVRVVGEYVFDLGYWSYTTILAVVTTPFEPRIVNDESVSLEWVHVGFVADRPLHPDFASTWPDLRAALRQAT